MATKTSSGMKNNTIRQKRKRLLIRYVVFFLIGVTLATGLCSGYYQWKTDQQEQERIANELAKKQKEEEERKARLVALTEIPVLSYHAICSDEEKDTAFATNQFVVSKSSFDAQMAYLKANNYKALTMDEFYDWYKNNTPQEPNTVVITFDDGYTSGNRIAEPILKKYGLTATTFVIGASIKDTKQEDEFGKLKMSTKDEIKDSPYMKYASHTYGLHGSINGSYKVEIASKDEIKVDMDKIGQYVNNKYVAYPFGRCSDSFEQAAKEKGVHLIFSFSQNRKATREDSAYFLPRIDIPGGMRNEEFIAYLQ